jgi:NADH dehydrogenase (ubiquinone) Fe-S protein 1
VAVVGSASDLTYDYMHLGSSTDVLKGIANGTHPFAERLKKAAMPMVMVGHSLL